MWLTSLSTALAPSALIPCTCSAARLTISTSVHGVWLGWLPLDVVAFAGPGVALARDRWLTVPSRRSERPQAVLAGDLVTAQDAAGELVARGECGLTAYTNGLADVSSDGPLWASSVTLLVADDLAVCVDRLRTAHAVLVECVDGVEQERLVLDACQSSPSGDSPVRRRCGRAVRDLQEQHSHLHQLLGAVMPASASSIVRSSFGDRRLAVSSGSCSGLCGGA